MALSEFPLPDVGEGLTEAEIVSWKIQPGDTIEVNQVLVEIETAKSLVELPSPFAGTVSQLLVAEGDTVEVGTPIIRVDAEGPVGGEDDALDTILDTAQTIQQEEAGESSGAVLVGYGSGGQNPARRRRRIGGTVAPDGGTDAPQEVAAKAARPAASPARAGIPVIAKPPIRKLAKDLDVDLSTVTATGPAGEILREDVIRHAEQASVFRNLQTPEWGDVREERIPVKGVRKAVAENVSKSKFSAPHVSIHVDVNATRTMEFVQRLKNSPDFVGIRVSPLLVVAKAVLWAARRNPMINASWAGDEIVVRHYVNLGIAAATPRGLIVPNVKDAQRLSLLELAKALEQLTLTAREGKATPADLSGGTITISNIGVWGMDWAEPILTLGEAAILAFGAIKQKPWVVDGEVRPAWVTTVGGSFDHRVVDGDVISRFVADVAAVLEEPALLLD